MEGTRRGFFNLEILQVRAVVPDDVMQYAIAEAQARVYKMVSTKKKGSAVSQALAAAGLPTLDALPAEDLRVLALPPGPPSTGDGLTAEQVWYGPPDTCPLA